MLAATTPSQAMGVYIYTPQAAPLQSFFTSGSYHTSMHVGKRDSKCALLEAEAGKRKQSADIMARKQAQELNKQSQSPCKQASTHTDTLNLPSRGAMLLQTP